MPGFDRSILTNVGWAALTDAEAGKHIEYTHLEAGDGEVFGGDAEMFTMTALKHKITNFPITNFSNDGQGQITLVGVLSSENVTSGFLFREIGVRCTIDGGPSILYAVANAGAAADYMPSSSEAGNVVQTVQIVIKIDRATNVTVVVQAGLDVTCQNIGPGSNGAGWFRDKTGNVCWFKRILSPKKTLDIIESSDQIKIDIPFVDQDLNMYVALGNPDIFPNFSTIQKALDYLAPLTIKPGVFATITVSAGNWVNNPTTFVDHPQGSQIKIIGTIGTVKNLTSASGSSSAVTVNAAVGAFNDMAVGDYFMLRMVASGGARVGHSLSGIRQVTAKAGNGSSITYNPAWLGTTFPSNLAAINGGTVTPMKTILSQSAGLTTNMLIRGNGLGLLKNIVSLGGPKIADPGPTGVFGLRVNQGTVRFENVGAYKWQVNTSSVQGRSVGIGVFGGYLECADCACCECASGFMAGGHGEMRPSSCYGNSNDFTGFRCEGLMVISDGQASGNDLAGLICQQNATLGMAATFSSFNKTYGIFVTLNAYTSGSDNNLASNGTRDVHLTVVSSFIRTAGPALVYSSANIAPNSLSADGCYFSP